MLGICGLQATEAPAKGALDNVLLALQQRSQAMLSEVLGRRAAEVNQELQCIQELIEQVQQASGEATVITTPFDR